VASDAGAPDGGLKECLYEPETFALDKTHKVENGVGVLPSGRLLTPAGVQLPIGLFPGNMAIRDAYDMLRRSADELKAVRLQSIAERYAAGLGILVNDLRRGMALAEAGMAERVGRAAQDLRSAGTTLFGK